MAAFTYKAVTKDGKRVDGTVQASSRSEAMAAVRKLGHTPLSISEAGGGAGGEKKKPAGSLLKMKFGRKATNMKSVEVLLFTGELADLLEAGMTLGQALSCLANQGEEDSAQRMISQGLCQAIVNGEAFSDAIKRYPDTFPPLYSNMVHAGESSGAMVEVLRRLVEHYERNDNMRGKIKSALSYPIVVLCFGVIAVIAALVWIIPQFQKVFDSMGASLPLPTRILIAMSHGFKKWGWLMAILVALGVVWFKKWKKTPSGRLRVDSWKLKVPLIKGIVANGIYASLAFTNALEPILIVLIAAAVGFVAIAILMAVFNMSKALG